MRPSRPLVLIAALSLAAAATAQSGTRRTPAEAAAAFSLDPAAQPTPAATPTPEPTAAPPAAEPAPAAAETGAVRLFTLDTPIGTLIGDPGAKGVLDRDLPGLSSDENLDKFRGLSLRQFQPLTGGQLTVALMQKVAGDLAALAGLPDTAPRPVAGRKARRGDTGR